MAVTPLTLWHNPRCSKSRQALSALQEAGAEVTLRLYLQDPPTLAELQTLLDQLDGDIRDLIRSKEPEFKAQGLTPEAPAAQLLQAIAATPKLLQRPIVQTDSRAVIARTPEALASILTSAT